MKLYDETTKERILKRNKEVLTQHNRRIKAGRDLYEDHKLAREMGLTIDEIRGEKHGNK